VFIVIGAVGYVARTRSTHFSFNINSIEQSAARDSTHDAYSQLASATNTFKTQTQACTTQPAPALQCLEQADTAWATAIQSYGTALSGILYPTSAQPFADSAEEAAQRASQVVTSLADSSDAAAYSAASQSPQFQSSLNDVDSTYNALIQALGG
jgi:hypothetical protein